MTRETSGSCATSRHWNNAWRFVKVSVL